VLHPCRRIEFLTKEDFPCIILATDDYGKSCSNSRRSRSLLQHNLGQQQQQQQQQQLTDLQTADSSSSSSSLKQQVQQLLRLQDQADDLAAAADSSQQLQHSSSREATYFSRRLLQEAPKCPTSRGTVLVLAPYLREFRCAFGDEAADIALLFGAAGYNVTFKCNDLGLCPAGAPILDDYQGWSKHVFVVVSSIGDDNAAGEDPIIMSGASLDFQNTNYIVSCLLYVFGQLPLPAQ
jgi:hypothetical protein